MSVLVSLTMPAQFTTEVYDQVVAQVRDQLTGTTPGFQVHAVHEGPDGLVVTEIWDSEADFQAFFDRMVAPNLPGEVPVDVRELHNVIIGD